MKAMILAAGVGSRLDPLTRSIPKPMVSIVGRPVIEHIVEKLRKHGLFQIMINLHYLGDTIQNHLGDGARLGARIEYAHEDQLWGDAGSVKRSESFFRDGTFLVVGGDDISNIDLSALVDFHKHNSATSTIALTPVDDPSEFGIVLTEEDGRIYRFLEKPKGQQVFSNTANTGVYVFEPEVFDIIPSGQRFGFGLNVFPRLLEQGKFLYGLVSDAYWKDVGNIQVYRQTNFDALAGKVTLEMGHATAVDGNWIGENAAIHESARLIGPVYIGNNVTVGAGACIGENCVLGDGVVIGPDVTLRSSILWEGARVGGGTHLEKTILGRGAQIQSNVAVFDGLVVDPRRPGE